ncbi:FtsH protease activity modulator HflK [uncultured Aquimonas sp.]|uniref:FtsH protease activity modulator HflK n=1 Tax=uncultured Aquimonas sp. TaxID=385483 RepID=UPI00086B8CE8|nr:FtsH protease activity modulator HflK [uncultured Aquimonas sp.]ODU48217.1 MAG: HflK protein [Xanthomonadaceae bacterium SCN 69-123]
MAWNQPGGGNSGGGDKDRDPWNSNKDPGADVEAFLNKLKASLNRVFGGGGSEDPRRGDGGGDPMGRGLLLLVLLAVAAWAIFDSVVLVDERERGVVLRFGKFDRIMPPGPNFKWPSPIESVQKLDVTRVRSVSDQVRLLTADENIVQIDYGVQFVVSDPKNFFFGTREPEETLKQAAESAIRDVIGGSQMDAILTGERAALAAEAQTRLQATLDSYTTGLQVTVLNIPNARPPQEVREAFDDAISAREDKERIESEAEAYRSTVVPEARGEAARVRTQAEGYREAAIARATGEAERFRLLAEEYRKAPEVTRRRLYLETMQEVLANNRTIYSGDGSNVLYLPVGDDGGQSPQSRLPAAAAALPQMQPSVPSSNRTQSAAERNRNSGRPERPTREEMRR